MGNFLKNPYFPRDTYTTPPDMPRELGDRLFFNSRWWFYIRFLQIVFRSRSDAVKGIYNDKLWAQSSFDIFRALEGCGGRFHIEGMENLRKSDEPVVIVSNHMSTLETLIFPGIIAPVRPITFIVKDSLVRARVFGPIMRSRDPIVVGRKNPREDYIAVLKQGPEILSKGRSIIVFPQSTRYVKFIPEKFNSMGVKLAKRAGVKVIPVAIKTDFWENAKIGIRDFGRLNRSKSIHMRFGEPMFIHGSGREAHTQIVEFIQTHLKKWEK